MRPRKRRQPASAGPRAADPEKATPTADPSELPPTELPPGEATTEAAASDDPLAKYGWTRDRDGYVQITYLDLALDGLDQELLVGGFEVQGALGAYSGR